MKGMIFLRRVTALCAVLAMAAMLTACYETPSATVTDLQGSGVTATTKATVPAQQGQLTLSGLMGIMAADMDWSTLSAYTHTAVDATHATFAVADGYGKECTLSVTYDEAANTVREAMLSYGDTAVDVLNDDTLVIREIMVAMNEG